MITSAQNPIIQAIRAVLGHPRQRREAGVFVIEGVRLAEEAVNSGWPVQQAFYSENLSPRGQKVIQELIQASTPTEQITTKLMQSLTETETSQGLLLVMAMRSIEVPPALNFVVIADAIRDPGNLGALLRTAWAASVQAVLLTPTTADPFSPKVLRSGMGAHFHLPILDLDWPAIRSLLKECPLPLQIFMAEAHSGASLWQTNLSQPCAVLVGNEAEGPSLEAHHLADASLHIPMPGQSESLNAAAAAAILLFELVRQRKS